MSQPVRIDEKCRACLVENFSKFIDWSLPIEGAEFEGITYMDCFQRYTQLDVDNNDQLPQILCSDCAGQLRGTYDFIKKATESHKALLLKLLSLQLSIETEAENFEYVTVEQAEEDTEGTEDELLPTISKSSFSEKEQRFSIDSREIAETDSSYLNKTTINPLQKKKRGRPKLTFPTNIEKLDSQDEDLGKCDFCSETFTQKKMKRHMSRVHNVKTLLCHACPRTFKEASTLHQHTLTHDEDRERNYTCELCEKKFLARSSYLNHIKTHDTNRKPTFQCEHCEKSFFHKGSLKLHMLYHTGKTLECKICGKKYPRLVDLEIHLRTHSGDMPYKCTYCDKAFTQAGILKKHVRHHEGYRYKCDICSKEYLHQSTLIQHKKEHMGLPLKCLICGKGFVKRSKMKRHISGVHKIATNDKIEEFIEKVKTKSLYRGRILEM